MSYETQQNAATVVYELRITVEDKPYIVSGLARAHSNLYQVELQHIWDPAGADLASLNGATALTTAAYDTSFDAQGEANALARWIIEAGRGVWQPRLTEAGAPPTGERARQQVQRLAGANDNDKFSDVLIVGCGNLALFVYGIDSKEARRAIYYLHQTSKIPIGKWGSRLASTRTALREYLDSQLRQSGSASPANQNVPPAKPDDEEE